MSIQKRGDGYAVTVYDPARKGKKWVGTFPTKALARKAELDAMVLRDDCDTTVAAYAASWLRLHPRAKRATNLKYAESIAYFVERFADRKLSSFGRREARAWAIEHHWQLHVVRAMFSDARRDQLVRDNPFTELRLQQSRGRRDLDVLDVGQVAELATIARELHGPNFAAFILTAAYTGMRPGELFALTWPRVNFATSEIEVAASYSTKARETTTPKNGDQRVVVMFPEAAAALAEVPREDGGHVFRTITGRRLDGRSLHYYWNPVRAAAGHPSMPTYALRHFCAAHLLNTLGHEAEDVAYQLGHTDGGVLVRKLYGHPSETLARGRLKAGFGRKLTLVGSTDSPETVISGASRAQNAV